MAEQVPLFKIVAGWTAELGPFTLRANGEPLDLTGMVVALKLRSTASSSYVDTIGDVRVDPDQVANPGHVYFQPDAEDFDANKSPYWARFEITDGQGGKAYVPSEEPSKIVVFQM